jgi:hypothetical protein
LSSLTANVGVLALAAQFDGMLRGMKREHAFLNASGASCFPKP